MDIAISILCALCLTVASAECFRVLQMISYRPERGYFAIYVSYYFGALALAQVAVILLHIFVPHAHYVNTTLFAVVAVVFAVIKRKCPLKLTKRVLRMFAVELLVLTPLCIFVDNCYWLWLLPLFALLSWLVCLPIDCIIANRYLSLAQHKLTESKVCVIAITGSYGKTSVKDMLSTLLKDSITPSGSCNTPLGIAKFINSTNFDNYKYLVLEFGARKKGDIAKLCKLYTPFCGVVTGVCAQHLSTFRTFDNIIATKRELVENLPSDGFCVLNQSDEYARQFADSGVCTKYLSYDGIELTTCKVDFDGTHISLSTGSETVELRLPQISDYVVDTFAMCLQVALKLNQTVADTVCATVRVKQTPHRLELIRGAGCFVLDDSYNASIVGVASCVETLKHFDCAKVVITQGLVECGKQRRQLNERCGQLLGDVCEVAVVLGSNKKYLAAGLQSTNCKVLYAKSLAEAVQLASPHARGGILLFQNDLPDVVNL